MGDNVDFPRGIVGFNCGQQGQLPLGIAREGTSGHFLAVSNTQGSIDPDYFWSAGVPQRSFDAMSISKQPRAGAKVRAVTGPRSSLRMVVDPNGGCVEWQTTRFGLRTRVQLVTLAQTVCLASAHSFPQEDSSDLVPFDPYSSNVCCLGLGIQAPLSRDLCILHF